MSEVIYLSKVRLSFPKVIEATAATSTPGAKKVFGADFILTPGDQNYARFMGEVGKVATEKWKDQASAILQMIQGDRRMRCYGNGAEKVDKKTLKPYVGYESNPYVSASANEDRPPQIIRPDGTVVDNSNTMERQTLARKLYGGCYVNVALRPWCQDNSFGRAIRCELVAIQFSEDGTAFGEAPPDLTSMFGAVQAAPAAPVGNPLPWMTA